MKCTRMFLVNKGVIHVQTLWSQKVVSNVSSQKECTKLERYHERYSVCGCISNTIINTAGGNNLKILFTCCIGMLMLKGSSHQLLWSYSGVLIKSAVTCKK